MTTDEESEDADEPDSTEDSEPHAASPREEVAPTPSDAQREESSGSIDVESLFDHVISVAVVFAVAGVGFGVLVFLVARFGADATVVSGRTSGNTPTFVTNFITTGLTVALFFPLFLAPVTGLVIDLSIEDDLTALVAAAVGASLGAFLFVVIAGYAGDLQFPAVQTPRGTLRMTFDLAVGVVDGLLVGIVSGGVAGVSAVVGQYLD